MQTLQEDDRGLHFCSRDRVAVSASLFLVAEPRPAAVSNLEPESPPGVLGVAHESASTQILPSFFFLPFFLHLSILGSF